jgi:hypothetical protein
MAIHAPGYVEEAFERGECAIGRFWGQTHFYVPQYVAEKVGEERIMQFAADIFTKERLDKFRTKINQGPGYISMELPSVLDSNQEANPEIHLPDNLAKKIMDCYRE